MVGTKAPCKLVGEPLGGHRFGIDSLKWTPKIGPRVKV
jgi:hypothetical protein